MTLLHHHPVALLVNLLIGLLPHRRCRDQDAELVVAQAGDQARRPLDAAQLPQKTAVPCSLDWAV